ncbi:MAG: leucine-rich repeat domain-containing protein [Clostridia bacterium]|nr:leucine-rich repeat domain-containing protein [Clostridia bacterium]
MKKWWMPTLVVLVLALTWCAAAGAETTADGFVYTLQADGSAVWTGYTGPQGRVTIPAELDGHPLTAVEGNPLYSEEHVRIWSCTLTVAPDHPYLAVLDGVLFGKTDRRLISWTPAQKAADYVVPDGIRVIGPHAFIFAGIRSLTLPDSVTEMGDFAFAYCEQLRSVAIPGSLRVIPSFAFADDDALREIRLGLGVALIDEGAFQSCRGLERIELPRSLETLGYSAFGDCPKLGRVVIHRGTTTIANDAFTLYDGEAFETYPNPSVVLVTPSDSRAARFAAGNGLKTEAPLDWLGD